MHWSDTPTQGGGGWERHRTGGIVRRVGGLDDTLVFAHGGGHDSPMFRFDGSDWVPLASPGVVLAIHGTSPDLLYCVGARGLIARWDGVTWAAIPASAMGSFRDICVVSADEMYAVHEGGLWQGSVNGWAPRLTADHGTLLSVAKWNDEVWVGTTDRGLCQLRGEQLVSVKGNLFPTRLDARGPALITAQSNMVAATEDGSAYRGWTLSRAAEVWAQQPEPYWLR